MFSSIFSFVSNLFTPATALLKEIHAPEDEREKIQLELAKLQSAFHDKLIEVEKEKMQLEGKVLDAANKLAITEVTSSSWLTRNYRPALVVSMFIMIALNSFGILTHPLPDIFIQIFGGAFGILSIGRSIEKIQGKAD